ncbi:MAG: nuclear transport factor 2 family protein [Chloroflexota bacterium]
MRNKSINGIALLIVLALLLCMPLPSVGQDDMTDDYITAWEAYVDAWRTGDITLLEDTVTDDFTRHTQWDPTTVGREELAVVIAGFREAMDGVTLHPVTEEDVLIRGDYMWMRAGMTPPGMDEMGYYVGMLVAQQFFQHC